MDSLGFVSISVLASFNRVRALTSDPTLVRETLALSSLVEVRGDRARLAHGDWKTWVLPGATLSEFERADGAGEGEGEAEGDAREEQVEGEVASAETHSAGGDGVEGTEK